MDDEERHVFLRTEVAFRQYLDVFRNGYLVPRLTVAKRFSLPNHVEHLERLNHLAALNAEVLNVFARCAHLFISGDSSETSTTDSVEPSQLDESKVASTLRQLAREWSSDGVEERRQSFQRINDALCRYYPVDIRATTRVLVPGSGLGRLPFDLSLSGFDAIGNEFSTHMLLASHTMLNMTPQADAWTIYPYIQSSSHWQENADQYREVRIPDIWPAGCEQRGAMSMAVGNFEEFATSSGADAAQAIATCFFIDAPYNFVKTLGAITEIVEVGGLWVNFGPLHWHSEDATLEGLEFSLKDIIVLAESVGWQFLERESAIPATYCSTHPNRMARMLFDCEFWVAKRIR